VTKYPKGPAEKGRGNFSPIWEMTLHLFSLAKLNAPYCKEVCERGGYEPEGTNSDHPGLGTLTFRDKQGSAAGRHRQGNCKTGREAGRWHFEGR
jgi:hypothetical protein